MGISLLEINVLGHALCTVLTYFIWLHKPLDVQEPERLKIEMETDARLVAAMSITGRFGTRKPESAYIATSHGSPPTFVFPVQTDFVTGKSWIVGYGDAKGPLKAEEGSTSVVEGSVGTDSVKLVK